MTDWVVMDVGEPSAAVVVMTKVLVDGGGVLVVSSGVEVGGGVVELEGGVDVGGGSEVVGCVGVGVVGVGCEVVGDTGGEDVVPG